MIDRRPLTPELVDSLDPPIVGEQWVADAALKGFGVRLWAGKKGGGCAYGIRVRDQGGKIVRETYSVWNPDDWFARETVRELMENGNYALPLGPFLEHARRWARDRLNVLRGRLTLAERRDLRRRRLARYIRTLTLDQMAGRTLSKLQKSSRNQAYVDSLNKLYRHISYDSRASLLGEMDAKRLASEITDSKIPLRSSKVLQSFIGQIYKRASRWYGRLGVVAGEIQAQCYRLRRRNTTLPYPKIKRITDRQMAKLFTNLEKEQKHWRAALAIRLYFATGGKMRRVMAAEWRHIIDGTWYPYAPQTREYWFAGRERLDEEALNVLDLARKHHERLGITSQFIFPSSNDVRKPIVSIGRDWKRFSEALGWGGLPISHVVLRHKQRNTPSYIYSYYTFFAPLFEKQVLKSEMVSKIRNAHEY